MHIEIPDKVGFIISKLEEAGFEAYAVGGCIRDSILGREPEDWDITTSALPKDIKACFKRTVDTGIEHGTVTVLLGDNSFEVTTYRVDGEYRDLRHPTEVSFTKSLAEDLRRRDFTINAMAYNPATGLLDLFEGRKDLEAGIIRCVGVPDERFREDALRILRAVRFAAQLGFEVEPGTAEAISGHAANLRAVSRERILTEITKLICSGHIERIEDLFKLGLAPYIAGDFSSIDIGQLKELKACAALIKDGAVPDAFKLDGAAGLSARYVRFAFLTEGMKTDAVKRMLKELKSDNDTLNKCITLQRMVFKPIPSGRYLIKKEMSGMSPELFKDLLWLKEASRNTGLYAACSKEEDLDEAVRLHEDILIKQEPVYLKDLSVTGADLKAAGIAEGPEIGRLLKDFLDMVHRDPYMNTKEKLMGSLR